jgi:hypothetical protein
LGIFVQSSKLSLQKTFEIVVLMPIANRLEIVVQCNGKRQIKGERKTSKFISETQTAIGLQDYASPALHPHSSRTEMNMSR